VVLLFIKICIHKSIHNGVIYPPSRSGQEITDLALIIGWAVVPSPAAGPGCPGKPWAALDLFPIVGACATFVVFFFADKTTT